MDGMGWLQIGSRSRAMGRLALITIAAGAVVATVALATSNEDSEPFSYFDKYMSELRLNAPECTRPDYSKCPTPHAEYEHGLAWKCIGYDELCDDVIDCPNGEDEHPGFCMMHRTKERDLRAVRRFIHRVAGKHDYDELPQELFAPRKLLPISELVELNRQQQEKENAESP